MFHFSIRDLLGLAVALWAERRSIQIERESLAVKSRELAAKQKENETLEGNIKWRHTNLIKLEYAVRERFAPIMQRQLSSEELEFIKEQARANGAPQPLPLPPGFGELPNEMK